MRKVCGVYLITCVANGKQYVGSSLNIGQRWYKHRRQLITNTHGNANLQNAWNKYGSDEFLFRAIEETGIKNRVERERAICLELKPEFNNLVPDVALQRWTPSDETLTRISDATKRAWDNPESRNNMIEGHKRRWADPEQRRLKSEAMKAHYESPEARAKLSAASRMSEPEMRAQNSESHKGIIPSDETRRKMSISQTKRQKDAARRAGQLELIHGENGD